MGLSHSPRIVTDGLVGYWDAGNARSYPGSGTTWTDLSGNVLNGTLTSTTFSSSNGGSLVFDGLNSISDHGTSSTLNLTTALTLDAWIYPTGWGEGSLGRIIQRTDASELGYILFAGNTGIYSSGIVYVVNASTSVFTYINNVVALNTWANFTVTHGGGVATIYKNGINIGSANLSQATTVSSNFYIGNRSAVDRTFQGNIPCVKVYNRALSATEVLQNYNALRGRYGI